MNKLIKATLAGGALFSFALGFPGSAEAAPSGIGSARDTIDELENSGYKVVLNKLGVGPLELCTVDLVRPGETVTRPVHYGTEMVNQVVYQTVYLTAKC